MQILTNVDLSHFHSFSIAQTCHFLVAVENIEDIQHVYQNPQWSNLPKLILGKGSNVLFTEPYQGVVLVNRLLGKSVSESEQHWHLHVAGGEDWPSLVKWSVEQGYLGLENLALIPGCAGSAPIQNIGAYGVELKDMCEYVDVLDLDTFELQRLTAKECQFGYRDSIFKHQLLQKVAIVAVGLKLNKQWQPNIDYGPLQSLNHQSVTAQSIFERVCQIRQEKLPDPAEFGNAGSFFKNPVISLEQFKQLQNRFADIAAYPAQDEVKIAAGWLIDQCQLKGFQIGGAQVHPKQALVLINKGNATANDIIQLATAVRKAVLDKFQIRLEHEVRFIGAEAETNLQTILEGEHNLESKQ